MFTLPRVFLALALALCVLMPSTQSLWIDEAQTWRFASEPTVGGLFSALEKTHTSEGLMPLGMLMSWVGIRIFGVSEWQLRAVNIFWAAAAVAAFHVLGRRWRAPWAPLLLAIQPFLWYYANEARPYTMQIAAGAWLLVGLVTCVEDRRVDAKTLLILLASSGILIGTVLFGILVVGPACLLIVWLAWREHWPLVRHWKVGTAVLLVWSASFGIYYLAALSHGATGAKLWEVGFQNVAFACYEFLGFSGLGLSRQEIREAAGAGGVRAVLHSLPLASVTPLAALSLTYLVAGVGVLRGGEDRDRRTLAIIGGVAAFGGGLLVLLALIVHFPFWGRHLSPVFPFFCGFLVLALRDLGTHRKALAAVTGCILFLLLAVSSLALRTWPRHAKDDYRMAAISAQRAVKSGIIVWWCADQETARYYGLPIIADPENTGPIVLTVGIPAETLAGRPPPGLIVMSKPDLFDGYGVVSSYARKRGYVPEQRMNAFVLLAPAHR